MDFGFVSVSQKQQIGVIAQDLEKIFLIKFTKNRMFQVDVSG